METFFQDLRYGLRVLVKNPGFALVAVLALALGIGANTALFSVVNALLLRPLPFRNLDRLVAVWETVPEKGIDRNEVSLPNYLDWRAQNKSFEHLGAYSWWSVNVSNVETPERVQGFLVTPDLLQALEAKPILGRTFLPEEEQAGKDKVVILSYGFWQREFAGDPNIVGKVLTLNNIKRTVVGVMPRDFDYPTGGEMWAPFPIDPQDLGPRYAHFLLVVGQLKAGVTREQAQSEMNNIAAQLEQQYPDTNRGRSVALYPLLTDTVKFYRDALLILLGAVGFVLLIACVNVANLLLAKAAGRGREMAIRAALGAGRLRIIRQLITESTLLAIFGGLFGILFAFWGVDLLMALFPRDFVKYISGWNQIGIDARVLAFTVLISLLTGIIFGLAPALQFSKPDLNDALKEGSKGTPGVQRSRLRGALVISEVALSLVLLIGAGLMIRSFTRLLDVKPGFNPDQILTAEIALPFAKYKENQQPVAFYQQLIARVGQLPGVVSAGASSYIPLAGANATTRVLPEGIPEPQKGQEPETNYRAITPNYFRTMEIPVLRGRDFTDADRADAPRVLIVNESFARKFWPGEDPVGKRVKNLEVKNGDPWMTVVAVVGDVKHTLDKDSQLDTYFPHAQESSRSMVVVVRTTGDPLALTSSLRGEVQAIDKDQPVYDIRTMEQVRRESIFLQRLSVILLAVFAIVALLLSAIGIYGVMNYAVTQRTHEIGVRMALGAQSSDVLRMVVGQGMILAIIGTLIGLGAAFWLTRLMSSLLFGITATDPLTFTLVSLILILVAFIACFIPARRATKVDPMVALRYE